MKLDFRNTKIRIESEEHSKVFQESVFAAGGKWRSLGSVLLRTTERFLYVDDNLSIDWGTTASFFETHEYKEIYLTLIPAKDICTKHKEDTQMKQICVNVSDLTIEEKQRVNEALAKIKNIMPCPPMFWGYPMDWESVRIMFVTSYDGGKVGFDCCANRSPTHTPQQVLEMAGIVEQGHVHAELMAQYAEDAKTHAEPWVLWQIKDKDDDGVWFCCQRHPIWATHLEYRRKPKTKLIHGVEIPVFEFTPKVGERFYVANVGFPEFFDWWCRPSEDCTLTQRMIERGLVYPCTEEGKKAAILHSKAMLGIAYLSNAHHTHI